MSEYNNPGVPLAFIQNHDDLYFYAICGECGTGIHFPIETSAEKFHFHGVICQTPHVLKFCIDKQEKRVESKYRS